MGSKRKKASLETGCRAKPGMNRFLQSDLTPLQPHRQRHLMMRLLHIHVFILLTLYLTFLVASATATFPQMMRVAPFPPPPRPPPLPPFPPKMQKSLRRDVPHRLAPVKMRLNVVAPSPMSRGIPKPRPTLMIPLKNPTSLNNPFHQYQRGKGTHGLDDLKTAAQTLYDLRGFNIPLTGQADTQRFLRQNDPFTFNLRPTNSPTASTFQHLNNRNSLDGSRTAPLVFPSFYQHPEENGSTTKRPSQGVVNIFGHTQHLSQTKYEPANHNGISGNSNVGGIQTQSQTFRPSQVDVSYSPKQFPIYKSTQSPPLLQPSPSAFSAAELPNQLQARQIPEYRQVQPQGTQAQSQQQQILHYRAPQLGNNNNNNAGKSESSSAGDSSEDPFVYVYDDEDYDEGEDDFDDKPQNQINNNRVTTPNPTSSPLRSGQVIFPNNQGSPSPSLREQQQSSQRPVAKPLIQTTTTSIPLQQRGSHIQNNDFYNTRSQPHSQSQGENSNFFFNQQGQTPLSSFQFPPSPRFTPTITPTPNVEINPSSERKPPPDQSNAIQPALNLKPSRVVQDDRFRRPQQTTNQQQSQPQYQQQHQQRELFPQQQHQQQQQQQHRQQPHPFNQQIISLEDEEEDEGPGFAQGPNFPKLNSPFSFNNFNEPRPETKLRPVNTLVPKNRVPQEDIILPHNFPFHEDIPINRPPPSPSTSPATSHLQNGNRGDIIRQNVRPQQGEYEIAPVPHRLRPTTQQTSTHPPTSSQGSTRVRGSTPTRTTTPETVPKRTRTRPTNYNNNNNRIQPFPPYSPPSSTSTTTRPTTTSQRVTLPPRATTTTTTESYEDTDEYYDDDEDYEEVSQPPAVLPTVRAKPVDVFEQAITRPKSITSSNKSPIRPNFNNNRHQNEIDELQTPDPIPQTPRRVRPHLTTPSPRPQYIQPSFAPSPSPTRGHRQREHSTIESPPAKKTTTGKPLYYAGKMLAKEGGLYAGQVIPPHHVYGKPVPHVPINSVFDRMPSVLDGNVAKTRQQQRVRGNKERDREVATPVYSHRTTTTLPPTTPHSNPITRLIHPSRIRPTVSHSTTTPTTTTYLAQTEEPIRESPRRPTFSANPKFVRPQRPAQSVEEEEEDNASIPSVQPPRRKKIRPGQRKKLRQQLIQQSPPEQSILVSTTVRQGDENEDEQDKPEPPRRNVRPNLHRSRPQHKPKDPGEPVVKVSQSHSYSSTESSSTEPPPSSSQATRLRPRKPRPPPQKAAVVELVSPVEDVEDQEPVPIPPPTVAEKPQQKRIRLRQQQKQQKLRQSEQSEPNGKRLFSSSSTQATVKIGRKPTEAPNRFSSRFKDDPVPVVATSTISSSVSDADEDFEENSPKYFSPPPKTKPRPSFKPPASKSTTPAEALPHSQKQVKPVKRLKTQQLQQREDETVDENNNDDDLPPSIRLSAQDVVLNRKPARRIPPGSASHKLKSLQERRKKVTATPQSFRNSQKKLGREEEDNEGEDGFDPTRGHRTIRRRKLLNNDNNNAETDKAETETKPLRRVVIKQRPRLGQRRPQRPPPPPQKEEEEEEEREGEDDEQEEKPVDQPLRDREQNKREIAGKSSVLQRKQQIKVDNEDKAPVEREEIRGRPRASGRTPSEVTSDEARAVLGIPITGKKKSNKVQPEAVVAEDAGEDDQNYEEVKGDEDYEGHSSFLTEQRVSTEGPIQSHSTPSTHSTTLRTSTTTTTTTTGRTVKEEEEEELQEAKDGDGGETEEADEERTNSPVKSTSTTTAKSTEQDGSTTAAYLKARLRPNKKLLSSLQLNKPKLSPIPHQQRIRSQSSDSGFSKLLKFRTSSSTYSPLNNSKIVTMSTEDPSLPLEDMFSNVKSSSKRK